MLEVRSREVPFVLEHAQIIGRLVFERLTDTPPQVYGAALGSNYQRQGLKLSKHFKVASDPSKIRSCPSIVMEQAARRRTTISAQAAETGGMRTATTAARNEIAPWSRRRWRGPRCCRTLSGGDFRYGVGELSRAQRL